MEYDFKNFTMSYKSTAKVINDRVLTDYFIRLMLIARSLFKYENLPNGIDEKWIERYLFSEGACLFYKDPKFGYMVAKLGETGALNYYDEPTTVNPYATNYIYAQNFETLMEAIVKAKPAAAKGTYLKSCTVTSTMGVGIPVVTTKYGV